MNTSICTTSNCKVPCVHKTTPCTYTLYPSRNVRDLARMIARAFLRCSVVDPLFEGSVYRRFNNIVHCARNVLGFRRQNERDTSELVGTSCPPTIPNSVYTAVHMHTDHYWVVQVLIEQWPETLHADRCQIKAGHHEGRPHLRLWYDRPTRSLLVRL